MEIQNLLSSPIYNEPLSKLRSKAKENARQSFADFIDSENHNPPSLIQTFPQTLQPTTESNPP